MLALAASSAVALMLSACATTTVSPSGLTPGAGSSAEVVLPAAPKVLARFDGLHQEERPLCRDCYVNVDTQTAVGDHQVVQQVASELLVYTKPSDTDLTAGAAPQLLSLRTEAEILGFGDVIGQHALNARLLYDAASRRYVISDMSEDAVYVAVSATEDATGPWYVWHQDLPHNGIDEPKLTVTTDKIIVGSYGVWWVLQKADVLAATSSPMTPRVSVIDTGIDTYGSDDWAATSTGTPDAHLVRTLYKSTRGYGMDGLAVLTVTGTPAENNLHVARTNLTFTHPQNPPISAPQPNAWHGVGIGAIKADVYSAVWADDRLWVALVDSCTSPGATPPTPTAPATITAAATGGAAVVTCIRLAQIDTAGTAPVLLRDLDLGIAGTYLLLPAIDLDPTGSVSVVASATSPTRYPSVVAAQLNRAGHASPWVTIREGTHARDADLTDGQNYCWFGDYAAISTDPSNPHRFWLGSQVADPDPNAPGHWITAFGVVDVAPSRLVEARPRSIRR
ncbi:hypothetical protein [Kineococcus sp. NPDC059986]|uniref:hypothetical protein n=1 Tax=Kineococcus sp. NPDC059986 TaxID=3155538 RepID=UPI00344E257F